MTDEPIDEAAAPEVEPEVVADAEPIEVVEASEAGVASRAKLILKRSGAATEHVFEFSAPAIVGRFDPGIGPIDIDLGTIDEGVYVSRKHARITCEDGVWKITDLGSSNGTFVLRDDFERVEEADLEDSAELAFGNARFIFQTSQEKL
jgi:hypothetical protein